MKKKLKMFSKICSVLFLLVILVSCNSRKIDRTMQSIKKDESESEYLYIFLGDWQSIDSDIEYNLKIRSIDKMSVEISFTKKEDSDHYVDYKVQKSTDDKLFLADNSGSQLVKLFLKENVLTYVVSSASLSDEGTGKPILFEKK